ncbi:MAG: phosphatidylserine decarboxylase [Ruminococcus sp.]
MKKESASIRFLYNTAPGRMALKLLVKPGVSKAAYYYMDSPLSKWLIGNYIRKYGIDMELHEDKRYRSFNDFFIRQKKVIQRSADENALISPCDGFLSVYRITPDVKFNVKHVTYNMQALLDNKAIAERYRGGLCMIYRLAPHNYHRYIFTDSGEIRHKRRIEGELHCVRPMVCEKLPVYIRNSREYTVLKSDNFGCIVQMEVGALLVGRICNHEKTGRVRRYEEKGYFEFGGSTIIMLMENGKAKLRGDIAEKIGTGEEVTVNVGHIVGRKITAEK